MLPRALELFPRRLVTCGPSTRSSCAQWSVLWINGKIVGADSYFQGAIPFDQVGQTFMGEVAEVLVFDQPVNSVNRKKIEGYLVTNGG